MPEDRRSKSPRRKGRSSGTRSQGPPSRGRHRPVPGSGYPTGFKDAGQTAATPGSDPFLDLPEAMEWPIPPVVASRFGLPVRFHALWKDEPLDSTFVTNLRPTELWEALFATLWRLAKQKDQSWTKRIEYEIDYRLFKASRNPEYLIAELLSLKRVPTGRPRGSGGIARLGNSLPMLHKLLSSEIRRGRTRERECSPMTMTALEEWWEEHRDIDNFPIRDFPKAKIQRELAYKRPPPPTEIADIVLAEAFGVSAHSVRAYLKKALRRIPENIKAKLGLSHRFRKAR